MSAARRKGKWVGGMPVLGYDVDPRGGRLVVNDGEAAQVREIYSLDATCRSLATIVAELQRRQWTTKSWTTKHGSRHAGSLFDKATLLRMLTNVIYVGKVEHKGTTRPAVFKWRQTEPVLILSAVRWCGAGCSVYAPELEERLRRHLKPTNKFWRVDETCVRVKGRWCYLYRAIDSTGATIDFLLSAFGRR